MNYDGEKVTDEIGVSELRNKEIKEAVKTVIVELKNQGYIDDEKMVGIVVAASSKSQEKTDILAEKLKTAVEKEITTDGRNKEEILSTSNNDDKNEPNAGEKSVNQKDISKAGDLKNKNDIKENAKYAEKDGKGKGGKARIEIIEVSGSYVDTAKANGVTPGKWSMVEQLKEKALKNGREFGENEFKSWLDKPVKDIMKEINKYNKKEHEIEKASSKDKKEDEKKETEKKDIKDTKESGNDNKEIKKDNEG